jgi:hypothetical protein
VGCFLWRWPRISYSSLKTRGLQKGVLQYKWSPMDSRPFGDLVDRPDLALCNIKVMFASNQYQDLVAVSWWIRILLQHCSVWVWMGLPSVCNISITWNWLMISTICLLCYVGCSVGFRSRKVLCYLMIVAFINNIQRLGLFQRVLRYIRKLFHYLGNHVVCDHMELSKDSDLSNG